MRRGDDRLAVVPLGYSQAAAPAAAAVVGASGQPGQDAADVPDPRQCQDPVRSSAVYAIVRSGGKQHKVAVGDVLDVELLPGAVGSTVALPALLLVDGADVTHEATALAGVTVTAEVQGETKGPKIRMIHYKNKSGYRRRQGHRQHYTSLRVTAIEKG